MTSNAIRTCPDGLRVKGQPGSLKGTIEPWNRGTVEPIQYRRVIAQMESVAIIGAGELGATIARTLACRGRIGEIRLIDEDVSVAAGKALDIQQAGPIERADTRVSAFAEIAAAAGAGVVIIADRVPHGSGEWRGEAGLGLVKRLNGQDPAAVLLCAGGLQRDLVERGIGELRVPRERLIGSAPEAVASAVRVLVALEAGTSPGGVSLSVVGIPPDGIVVPWSEAAIAGCTLTSVLSPPQLTRVSRRVPALWPPGPYALASAAARVTEAIMIGSTRVFSCFVVPDGHLGVRRVACAFPVVLGRFGIERLWSPTLSVQEQVQFENSVGGRY